MRSTPGDGHYCGGLNIDHYPSSMADGHGHHHPGVVAVMAQPHAPSSPAATPAIRLAHRRFSGTFRHFPGFMAHQHRRFSGTFRHFPGFMARQHRRFSGMSQHFPGSIDRLHRRLQPLPVLAQPHMSSFPIACSHLHRCWWRSSQGC